MQSPTVRVTANIPRAEQNYKPQTLVRKLREKVRERTERLDRVMVDKRGMAVESHSPHTEDIMSRNDSLPFMVSGSKEDPRRDYIEAIKVDATEYRPQVRTTVTPDIVNREFNFIKDEMLPPPIQPVLPHAYDNMEMSQ